jgi:hypothetical protein
MPTERALPPLMEKEAVIPARSIDLDQIVGAPSRLSAARVTRVGHVPGKGSTLRA